MGAQNQRTKNTLLLFYNEDERMRMRERERQNFPRACSCVFLILNAAFAQEERYNTNPHVFLSVQKFSRLNYVLKSLATLEKSTTTSGRNSKHFP